jgi:outer membrane lipoprotein-sorting protein
MGVMAAGFVLVFNVLAVTESHAQVLNEILKRMDTHYKALSSLKSDLKMVKLNAQINESDTTEGVLMLLPKTAKRSMYARIDWAKPVVENIAVIGDSYTLYRPRLNQVYKGKTNKTTNKVPGGALAFLSMSKAQLMENYLVDYLGQEQISGGTQTWHLRLTPKAATSYKTAEIWVDGDGMPQMAKVSENNGDTTTIQLSNINKNVTINGSDFVINYPKSIKPIQG